MYWKDKLARWVVSAGLKTFAALPFLRRPMVWFRPYVTRLLYNRQGWDYMAHLASERYKDSGVALIQAPGWGVNTPPLATACLTAYLREHGVRVMPVDINVEMFNRNKDTHVEGWMDSVDYFWNNPEVVDNFIKDNRGDLDRYVERIVDSGATVAGFTIFDSSYLMSCHLARELKKRRPGMTVVFGGAGASKRITGRDIIRECDAVDFVVEGEGEVTLLKIAEAALGGETLSECPGASFRKDGVVVAAAFRMPIKDIDSLPYPDFSDFNFFRYREPFKCPIESSRGCINRCVFCNERTFWDRYRSRGGESIFDEMKYQLRRHPHVNYFEFQDSLVNGNITELGRLSDLIISEKLPVFWGGQAVVRKEMDFEFFSKIKSAGCVSLAFGLESTSKSVLEKVGKVFARKADIDGILRDAYRAGVGCGLNFMFGLPGETDEEAQENVDFIRRNAKYIYAVNPSSAFCLLYPGTEAYENPESFGIDLKKGSSYWDSMDGTNTYLKRLERFERFVSEVHRLNIPCVYPHPALVNRNEMIADYYYHTGSYGLAIPFYEKSIETESSDEVKAERLRDCRERAGIGRASA